MNPDIAKAGWLHRQSVILHRWKRNWFVLRTNGDLLYFETPEHSRAEERIVVRAHVKRIMPGFELNNVMPPEGMAKGSLFGLDMTNDQMKLCAESPDDMKAWQVAIEEARVMTPVGSVPPPYTTTMTSSAVYPGRVMYNTTYPGQTMTTYPGQTTTMYPGQTTTTYPGQTVHTSTRTVYPGQTTVYTSPGVQAYPPGTVIAGPNGSTTVVANPGPNVVYVDGYRHRRHYDGGDMAMGVVAGAALGSMMWGPALWW